MTFGNIFLIFSQKIDFDMSKTLEKIRQISSICDLLYLPTEVNVKDSIFLKNRHFFIQERFNKLIYGINMIIKSGT